MARVGPERHMRKKWIMYTNICLDPYDQKTSRPVNMLSIVTFCIAKCIIILFKENGFLLCHVEVGEFDFGHLSLNLPYCVAPQTGIKPRCPWTRLYTRAVRFVLRSLIHNCHN